MYEIFEKKEDNEEIYRFYCNNDNFKVEDISNDVNKPVYIFFTGHGLFFPTTIEMFRSKVIENNRFEWENIARGTGVQSKARRIIYIRDVYKNWCINGINSKVNTREKLVEMLKDLAENREIITVGSSAGGYMAVLYGCLLNAKAIYTFSPQISLIEYDKWHPIKYFDEYRTSGTVALDLREYMVAYTGKLFYITPYYCPEDRAQLDLVNMADIPCIKKFIVDENRHGYTFYGVSIERLLAMDMKTLENLSYHYAGKIIKPSHFCARTSGIIKAAEIMIYRKMKGLLKRKNDGDEKNRNFNCTSR